MRVSNLYFCSDHTELCPDLCVNVNQAKNESGLMIIANSIISTAIIRTLEQRHCYK